MTTFDRRTVQHIKQRGNSLQVSLPVGLLKALGWNKGDVLAMQVIEKSLVMTRVELPKVGVLRKEQGPST